jgi:adenine-specific DNA-methyltransferase
MKLIPQEKLNKALDKALLKHRPLKSEISLFKAELVKLIDRIDHSEREEFNKNLVGDFLKNAIYKDNFINTKGTQDLVIHNGKDNKTTVGVIIEAKRPTNKVDWFTPDKPNSKALQELVLYYLRERIECNNIDIKYLIATNINEWYIIEASYFDKLFYKNKPLVKHYEEWRDGKKVTKDTGLFYNDIAKPFIDGLTDEIPCTYFNLKDHEKALRNIEADNNRDINALFKILSPFHLLKASLANDSNELDDKFYKELLHIIGLEEAKEGGKNIIRRKIENRNTASLLEKAIDELKTEGLHKVPDLQNFGDTGEEQYFSIALELCITWINRILFLKLLEGQLINYHRGDQQYRFLNSNIINDFDELFKLFHKVLAVDVNNRNPAIQLKYSLVPYLNSSLFEISDLEDITIKINAIDSNDILGYINGTILKEQKKKNDKLSTIDYLFQFLDAYDFASEDTGDTKEDNKTLINASVLGKVFEKINGYKDGSIYTPGFITMYMSRQSIRLAVVQKFNYANGWACKDFADLNNYIEYQQPEVRGKANALINDLKLCDPAVGSGHFLVSALNEIIAIKSELKILQDVNGRRLKEYSVDVVSDELIITDEDNELFVYNPKNAQSQLIQQTLFTEKQALIENCLFGVDINPNSVKICRLRLWIELLKNAYYKPDGNLETLPNIDINIKCGNSLISSFKLKDDEFKNVPNFIKRFREYSKWVKDYKNSKNREIKRQLNNDIKLFTAEFKKRNPKVVSKENALRKLASEFNNKYVVEQLFENNTGVLSNNTEKQSFEIKMNALSEEIDELKNNANYKNAFEWRFEFPEVLSNNGDFEGFDVIIGNPPYIGEKGHKEIFRSIRQANLTDFYQRKMDIFYFFFHLGMMLLKKNGNLSFITTNYFLTSGGGEILRNDLKNKSSIMSLINLNELKVFESAMGQHNLITQLTKGFTPELLSHNILTNETGFCTSELFNNIMSGTNQKTKVYYVRQDELYEGLNNYIRLPGLSNNQELNNDNQIFNKIIDSGTPLIQLCDISQGILSGVDRVSNKHIEKGLISKENINKGVYVLSNEEYKKFNEQEHEIIKPWFKNSDIHKYWTANASKYKVIYATRDIEIAEYPTLKSHFQSFENIIKNRSQDRGEMQAAVKLGKWWVIFAARTKSVFEGEKIVCPQRTKTNVFGYNNDVWYSSADVYYITNPVDRISLKYILALLNSKLYFFWLYNKGKRKGESLELYYTPLTEIPIKIIEEVQQELFIEIIDKIINLKQSQEDTTNLEQQIDALVYKLYDLTPDEIAIVENSTNVKANAPEIHLQDSFE